MSVASHSRPLQLERLESRCLLAAGFLSFSHGQKNAVDNGRNHDQHDRLQGDHAAEVRSLRSKSSDDHSRDEPRHDRDNKRFRRDNDRLRSQTIQPRDVSVKASTLRIVIPQPTESVQTTPRFEVVATNFIDNALSASRSEPTHVSEQRLITSRVDSPPVAAVEEAAAATAEQRRVVSIHVDASGVLFGGEVADIEPEPTQVTQSSSSRMEVTDRIIDAEPEFRAVDEMRFFDSMPLHHGKPFDGHESESEEDWQIAGDTIRQLRGLMNSPIPGKTLSIDAPSTDEAMVEWFNAAIGLVEIGGVGTPLCQGGWPDAVVNVDLEATLSLYRSLELMASTDLPPINRDVRGAVLAAIAAEQADVVSPVLEPAHRNASSAAFSGAALIAGALLVVNRRKCFPVTETTAVQKVNDRSTDQQ